MAQVRGKEQAADMAAVRERIEQWRGVRKGGKAMPAELWAEAVRLARSGEHSLYEVSRGLRVDYGALKQRVAKAEEAEARGGEVARWRGDVAAGSRRTERVVCEAADGDDDEAVRFIELDGRSLFGQGPAPERVVELVGANGRRMTIRQPAGAELDVLGLAAAFWRCRP